MSEFSIALRRILFGSIEQFVAEEPGQHMYGVALLPAQTGDSLIFALATEEGLVATAARYLDWGYADSTATDPPERSIQKLRQWLRWANPDDGWFHRNLNAPNDLAPYFDQFSKEEQTSDFLESHCVNALREIVADASWAHLSTGPTIVAGVTQGSDPDDFLRTATMIHDFQTTKRLWSDFQRARELDGKIVRNRE